MAKWIYAWADLVYALTGGSTCMSVRLLGMWTCDFILSETDGHNGQLGYAHIWELRHNNSDNNEPSTHQEEPTAHPEDILEYRQGRSNHMHVYESPRSLFATHHQDEHLNNIDRDSDNLLNSKGNVVGPIRITQWLHVTSIWN